VPSVCLFKEISLTKDDAWRWLAFAFIAAAVLIFYYPSLYYPPRGDQIVYLADTATRQNPYDLIFGRYDLSRNRIFAPGDEILFRPLLYAILGIEQVIFGHQFWAWQLFSLFGHLVLVWMLLKFLWRLCGGWLAFAGTWLFSLSWTQYELVTWPHLTSYVLMMAAVIVAVEQAFFCFEEGRLPWHRLLKITLVFLLVCFIYESANLFALWMMIVLIVSCPRMWKRALIIGVPVILYVTTSAYNFIVVNHLLLAPGSQPFPWGALSVNFFRAIGWWTYVGIFNGLYQYILMTSRTIFAFGDVLTFKPLVGNNIFVLLGLVLSGAFLGLVGGNLRKLLRPQIFLLVLVSGMLFIYVGVLVAGRQQTVLFINTLRINTHYQYIFWIFMTMMGFLLMGCQGLSGARRMLVIIFVLASILSGALQGMRIFQQAQGFCNATQEQIVLAATLDLLIKEKGQEPGFSFYVHPDYPGNYEASGVFVKPGTASIELTFANLLYVPYIQPLEKAKYKFLVRDRLNNKTPK